MSKHTPKRYRPEDQKPKSRKKIAVILASLCLACAIGVGSTVAFITTSTETVENTFTATDVTCAVQEDFNNNVKNNVSVKNTGNIDAYIRAYVSVTWQNEQGEIYGGAVPKDDTDYEILWYNEDTDNSIPDNWIKGADGFYYYKTAVAPEQSTTVLFTDCQPMSTAPDGYSLSVEIIASAIQSKPGDAVAAWSSGVATLDSNGSLIVQENN